MFSREALDDGQHIEDFSVPSPGQRGAKGRAFVRHEGKDTGEGVWTCSKDILGHCPHIRLSRNHLQQVLHADPGAVDDLNVETVPEQPPGKVLIDTYPQLIMT